MYLTHVSSFKDISPDFPTFRGQVIEELLHLAIDALQAWQISHDTGSAFAATVVPVSNV